jgi:hypothetical protein
MGDMTPRQRELARHALGLPNKNRTSYRNQFCAGDGHQDAADWEAMVAAGFASKRDGATIPFGGDHLFYLTDDGARMALEPREYLDSEDFPTEAR